MFQNLAAGNEPLSLFDTMFNVAGQQGNIPCTATGTNAISLVSQTNNYVGTSYTDGQIVSFQAAATTTGSGTMQWSGLGFVKLFTAAGVQVAAGDVVININYVVQYRSNLDTGSGGFIILNATVTAIAQPVQATFKNLVITVNGNTTVTPTADAVVVQNSGGGTFRITTFAPGACSTATTGANALDAGSVATSTWYAMYAIYNTNTSTAASLLSASFTSPTLPSGYTYSALIGAFLTDGSSNLLRIIQKGRRANYVVGTNPAQTVIITSVTATGTYSATSPTLAALSVSSVIPPIATSISLSVVQNWKGGGSGSIEVAPNTAWGGSNNGPNGTNGNVWPLWNAALGTSSVVSILLEGTTIGAAWSFAAMLGVIGYELGNL